MGQATRRGHQPRAPLRAAEAKVLTGRWRLGDSHLRPHSSLGDCPPAPEAIDTSWFEIALERQIDEIFDAAILRHVPCAMSAGWIAEGPSPAGADQTSRKPSVAALMIPDLVHREA